MANGSFALGGCLATLVALYVVARNGDLEDPLVLLMALGLLAGVVLLGSMLADEVRAPPYVIDRAADQITHGGRSVCAAGSIDTISCGSRKGRWSVQFMGARLIQLSLHGLGQDEALRLGRELAEHLGVPNHVVSQVRG